MYNRTILSVWAGVAFGVCSGVADAQVPATSPPSYTTSWIGNTFGGRDDKWVSLDMKTLFVTPDGLCLTNTNWDEGGREVGFFKNGDVVGMAGHTHGWGYGGGSAVTASDKYLFIGQTVENEGGGLKAADTWPAKGLTWFGVSRRHRDGSAAPFTGGKGGSGDTLKSCFLLVNEAPDGTDAGVAGLAAIGKDLFVSDPQHSAIRVYDTETMGPVRQWSVPRSGQMAADRQGRLWVIQAGTEASPARVSCYTPLGTLLPVSVVLPRPSVPVALALDPKGRLLVADNGPAQQVLIYDRAATKPRLVGMLGVRGGIRAGVPGQVAPLKFNQLTGVGADAAGNVYVSHTGSGAELKCFTPGDTLKWQLQGLEFLDNADADPASDGRDVYTKLQHFVMDYRKPVGHQWTYQGFTLDRVREPDDPRLHTTPDATWVRRIGGRRFLFLTDMYSSYVQVYRFSGDGEIALPCAMFARGNTSGKAIGAEHGTWPPGEPAQGAWVWRDATGEGTFRADEFETYADDNPYAWGWWADADGNIWRADRQNGLRWFPMGGLDAHGVPRYSVASSKVIPNPAPFQGGTQPRGDVKRVQYDAAQDALYLAGFTQDAPDHGDTWWALGRVVARYDHWSRGNRVPRWQITLPFEPDNAQISAAKALSVAGDYVFVMYGQTAHVRVYRAATGSFVTELAPGPEVGGKSGWVDIPQGIRAVRRSDGTYLIFAEEDWHAKVIQYQWRPR